jgi:hypothetical protein
MTKDFTDGQGQRGSGYNMKLLTKELVRQFPKIGATDGTPMGERKVIAKFFHPLSNWTWYTFEYDGTDEFFGLVDGHEKELGYFSLAEMGSVKVMGLGIERDLYFGTPKIKEIPALAEWLKEWEK